MFTRTIASYGNHKTLQQNLRFASGSFVNYARDYIQETTSPYITFHHKINNNNNNKIFQELKAKGKVYKT